MTNRIIIKSLTKDLGTFVDLIRAEAYKHTTLDFFKLPQYAVITTSSENTRDRLMPMIKTKLREYDAQAKA